MDHDAVLALRSSGPAYSSVGGGCVKRAGGTWERPTGAGRWLCARVRPQPPDPRQGTLVTSRMEVRSALGPAITRAGGIQGGRRPIMKMPFRVLVWPNLLIEAIKSSRPKNF